MSYKLKSLVYFTCFLASTIAYYAMDNDIQTNNNKMNEEIAELQMEPIVLDVNKTLK